MAFRPEQLLFEEKQKFFPSQKSSITTKKLSKIKIRRIAKTFTFVKISLSTAAYIAPGSLSGGNACHTTSVWSAAVVRSCCLVIGLPWGDFFERMSHAFMFERSRNCFFIFCVIFFLFRRKFVLFVRRYFLVVVWTKNVVWCVE